MTTVTETNTPIEKSDKFWAEDLTELFRTDRILEFFITPDQSTNEKLNSITRFGLYVSIILAMYHKQNKYLLLSLITFVITWIIYAGSNEEDSTENLTNQTTSGGFNSIGRNINTKDYKILNVNGELFTESTENNPLGNALPFDPPNRPEMIDYVSYNDTALAAKNKVQENINKRLYTEVDDIYSARNGQREFYTMPNRGRTPPDADGKFKKWMYGNIKSCKEDSINCNVFEDLRYKKQIFPNPNELPVVNSM